MVLQWQPPAAMGWGAAMAGGAGLLASSDDGAASREGKLVAGDVMLTTSTAGNVDHVWEAPLLNTPASPKQPPGGLPSEQPSCI